MVCSSIGRRRRRRRRRKEVGAVAGGGGSSCGRRDCGGGAGAARRLCLGGGGVPLSLGPWEQTVSWRRKKERQRMSEGPGGRPLSELSKPEGVPRPSRGHPEAIPRPPRSFPAELGCRGPSGGKAVLAQEARASAPMAGPSAREPDPHMAGSAFMSPQMGKDTRLQSL
eukprot:XP_022268743.1 WAS/WASL-interacting protein family member 1-like [Canis lupus familiaris]